jgi:hypothetical protein
MQKLISLFSRSTPDAPSPFKGLLWTADGRVVAFKADRDGTVRPQTRGTAAIPPTEAGYATAYLASVWANRCVNVRANRIAEVLHQGVVVDDDGQAIEDHPLPAAIDLAYEHFEQDVWRWFSYQRDMFGEVYVELVDGTTPVLPGLRVPMTFRVLPALAIEPDIRRGQIERYLFASDSGVVWFDLDAIAYYHTFHPTDTLRGVSLFAAVLDEVNVDVNIIRFDQAFFRNGAHPGLVIAPKTGEDFTNTDYDRLVAWAREKLPGVSHAFQTLPLSKPMDITAIERPKLEDQTYLADDMMERICAGMGVPVGLVNFADQPYQLSPEQEKNFVKNEIAPACRAIAKFITARVLPFFDSERRGAFDVELALNDLLATFDDQEKKERIARSRFESGRMTMNESRAFVGLDTVDDGDFLLVPSGYTVVPLGQLGELVELTAPANNVPSLELRTGAAARPLSNTLPDQPPPPQLTSGNGKAVDMDDDDDDPPQEDASRELRAWRRVALRKGVAKALDFECYHLGAGLQDFVRSGLQAVEADDGDAIAALFDDAQGRLAAIPGRAVSRYVPGKAIQATRLDFETDFEDLLAAGRSGNLDRRAWANRTRTLLRKYGERAYKDGLNDGGVQIAPDAPLDDDDQAELNRLLAEQSGYVTELGRVVFDKAKAVSEGQAAVKPGMWFNKSIMPIYEAGRLSADKNGMYEWVLGRTEEHCATCLAASGQRHRLRDWHRRGIIPRSDRLECQGFQCDCQLVRTTERARGRLDRIPLN